MRSEASPTAERYLTEVVLDQEVPKADVKKFRGKQAVAPFPRSVTE
jgi:hypothetical protein